MATNSSVVTGSKLWQRLSSQTALQSSLLALRETAEALGSHVERLLPNYTDHSVMHMDALWKVAETILTDQEIDMMSEGETFVLGASFYVHDLGMAWAATPQGNESLKATPSYTTAFQKALLADGLSEGEADLIAIQVASRELHATNAKRLLEEEVPGLGRFLIEQLDVRRRWSSFIADISSSHHWSLPEVDIKLGRRGAVPDHLQGTIDLAYVACVLRLIDYAHINSDRASYLSRILRPSIEAKSLLHWKAQEHITGPNRQENLLVFGSAQGIQDVEAWWLFYDMVTGLDAEISTVREYLKSRRNSENRFSLEGVRAANSPQSFATCVVPNGFEPVDVRFRPGSIERLVNILGGQTLYGDDKYAPLRELIQNARDAILLRLSEERLAGETNYQGELSVGLTRTGDQTLLSVSDNGVGMTQDIMRKYLLGIASDFWKSSDFFSAYPSAYEQGFRPAGKFGIGFLSVFMLGDSIEVQTQRHTGSKLTLNLRGLGTRGALRVGPSSLRVGTTVSVTLGETNAHTVSSDNLHSTVQARAPMLPFPVHINLPEGRSSISAGWWQTTDQESFYDFVVDWEQRGLGRKSSMRVGSRYIYDVYGGRIENFRDIAANKRWPYQAPEATTESYRVLAMPNVNRVLLCSRGIAVTMVPLYGRVGIVDIDDVNLTAARSSALDLNISEIGEHLSKELRPAVVKALDGVVAEGNIPARYEFLMNVARAFGYTVLLETALPWIPIIEPPGMVDLVASSKFRSLVDETSEVLITFGMGPWTAAEERMSRFAFAAQNALLVPVPGGRPYGGDFKEREGNREMQGPLFDLTKTPDQLERMNGLRAILSLVAERWGTDISDLVNTTWTLSQGRFLYGHLKRSLLRRP